ncbi:MAG: chromosomal replication initiator protein DnaA [Candidatus Palauibacterales bacterium]|nr:chromosomal replication initiator protein DnaA [Candidatus Palauibacterales bacterium]MDP2530987.1 chromosomal replication initiator protein DnaA [Candidatus Palauibacterales bacterium]MDP2583430.1 chromosomal replication initiator protein DnaA [Candidatus Palauibacterales bacterium]
MELTANEVWARITDAARDVLPEQTFRTWLSATEAVTLSDDTLVVGAPTKFAVEWIEDKYGPLLVDLAERQLGRSLELRFEHQGHADRIQIPEFRSSEVAHPSPAAAGSAAASASPSASGLNERYTFSRFVIGGNNQLAAAACQRVADAPAKAYNPLFIYGDTGLGKTHLMHAIGHAILDRAPGRRVAYIPSEQFTNEMISAIQSGRTPEFRQRYRRIDVLLVDDVHFLGNKEGTQEEFFHTFNSLYDAQKQIVITSDRPPQEIPGLQERLVSRFEWGLVTDIKPPDFETRVAILQKKAAEDRLVLDDEVIEYIARHRKTSVRQLEGAVIKLLAYSSLTRREITLELAREALGGSDEPEPEPQRATPEEIRRRTAEAWDVTVDGLTSRRRTRTLTVPRQIAMYLIKTLLDLPYTEIGGLFGGRDHSTVIHSVNKVEAEMASDPDFRVRVRELQDELRH